MEYTQIKPFHFPMWLRWTDRLYEVLFFFTEYGIHAFSNYLLNRNEFVHGYIKEDSETIVFQYRVKFYILDMQHYELFHMSVRYQNFEVLEHKAIRKTNGILRELENYKKIFQGIQEKENLYEKVETIRKSWEKKKREMLQSNNTEPTEPKQNTKNYKINSPIY